MSFVIDHVWIPAPGAAAGLERLSEATGLPVLDGWSPDGEVKAHGLRFAGGAFLDVHDFAWRHGPSVLLRGSLQEAEALAAEHGWIAMPGRREHAPVEHRPIWSILAFPPRQGVISKLAVIAYEADPSEAAAEYQVPLYAAPPPDDGPKLGRVWLGGEGVEALSLFGCSELVAGDGDGVHRIEILGVEAPSVQLGPVEVVFRP
ncbi:hypothetical protein [Phenylobacterium sp.]|uniref:hypothetical protein n=1 Tax=Phenylobacterium sp. TaxID=1871053 RepID=UPI0035AED6ED